MASKTRESKEQNARDTAQYIVKGTTIAYGPPDGKGPQDVIMYPEGSIIALTPEEAQPMMAVLEPIPDAVAPVETGGNNEDT